MGFLSRFFSIRSAEPAPHPTVEDARPARLYDGEDTLEVVGESFHQETLWALVGGWRTEHVNHEIRARLVPEPTNPEDPNAVVVLIDGQCVGHLSRHDAPRYLPGLRRLDDKGPVEVRGVICGGGARRDGIGFLGVFLDHDPKDFGIPRNGRAYGSQGMRTGFSEAVATDFADDSYDLSWCTELSDDNATAVEQLREMLRSERDPIDRHFMFSELARRLYKLRDVNPSALDEFDAACRDHDVEMAAIREALVAKFGSVPVIETYRQAVIRCQKARDWSAMRQWAERGISVYGDDAARPEAVEDLEKRLAYAVMKLDAANRPDRPRRVRGTSAATVAVTVTENLVCSFCGGSFERVRTRGRKPHRCAECRARD